MAWALARRAEGWSYARIGRALGAPESTLREAMRREGAGSTVPAPKDVSP